MAEEDKCPSLIALQSLSNLQFSMYCTTYTVAQTTTTATMCASSAEPGGALQAPFEFSGLKASDVASHSNQLPNQSASVASLPNRKTRNSCAKRKDDGSHRARSNFNEAQLMCLERSFDASPYASLLTRAKLSYETGISEAKIQGWFKNRRARLRRTASDFHSSNSAIDYTSPKVTEIFSMLRFC